MIPNQYSSLLEDSQTGLLGKINRLFKISERNSDILSEIRAGVVLFTTMSYILIVNPDILTVTGLSRSDIASSTAICAVLGGLILGLYANLPFGSAPGMGLNTYFAYELVVQQKMTVAEALAICFVAGCVFTIVGMTGFSNHIIKNIPISMKKAVIVGLGMYQALIGLYCLKFIAPGTETVLTLAPINNSTQYLALVTLLLMALLMMLKAPGSILIGVVGATVLALLLGISHLPPQFMNMVVFELPDLNWWVLLTVRGWVNVFCVFVVAFVDVGGCILGVGSQSPELLDEDGDVLGSQRAFIAVGLGIIVAALLGTSPVIIYLESAAAVQSGGRTGLTAVTTALLFGISAFFVPLISEVPRAATAPVLVLVGSLMMSAVLGIHWDRIHHGLPAFMTICMTAFTCSISNGIATGALFFAVLNTPVLLSQFEGLKWLKAYLPPEEVPLDISVRSLSEKH